jgi:hypothetical protein
LDACVKVILDWVSPLFSKKEPPGKTNVYCDILRTMPGLAISGLLSQLRLLAQLYSCGFIQAATVLPAFSVTARAILLSALLLMILPSVTKILMI